jgi:hypothetical protein
MEKSVSTKHFSSFEKVLQTKKLMMQYSMLIFLDPPLMVKLALTCVTARNFVDSNRDYSTEPNK